MSEQQQKCTLSDILYEYLGRPRDFREAAERMRDYLTPKEQEQLRELQARRKP